MSTRSVLEKAKAIARSQGRLANSPAEHDEIQGLTLCAGSCVAKAILEECADYDLLRDFEERLVSENKLSFIPGIFLKHGFEPDAALRVIKENDALVEPERSSWFSSLASL